MKNILKIIVSVLLVGTVYFYRHTISSSLFPAIKVAMNNINKILLKDAPCSQPIVYNLGTFDSKFGISKAYFLSALSEAEGIWEKSSGVSQKDLFTYDPTDASSDVLKINLVYDYRQEATSKLSSLGIVVKENKASYDALKIQFANLKTVYDSKKKSFSLQLASFNAKKKSYEDEVNYWNSRGGAPKNEYSKLQATELALEAESKILSNTQSSLNNMADEINALVVVLNRLVGSLNLSVEKYNTTNMSRGESFEEGVYISDGATTKIDIYEFSSRAKLVRVLSHELGHALGLDHVDDPKAIMYRLNQGNSLALSKADIDALNIKCSVK